MKNTLLSFLLLISFSSLILAQPIKNNSRELHTSLKKMDKRTDLSKLNTSEINSTTGTCISNAGTISSTLNGFSTTSPIYVCYNSCYTLASNNDYILPIPVSGETSELFYALYTGQPNLTIGPDLDPNFTSLFWTSQDLSDCNNAGSILLSIGLGNHFWLVPITADDSDNGGNPNGTIGYDNNGDLCYDYGNPIEVIYMPQLNSTLNVTMCNSYLWPSNSQTYSASGTYTTSAASVSGCDSIITLNLTILDSSSSSIGVTMCNEYTWNSNTYTTSGTYMYTTTNVVGCDSVAVLYLTINDSSSSTINITACDSYTWNNVNYTIGGAYTFNTINAVGCDSIATLNLIINTVNTSVTSFGSMLESDLIGATSYQWVDCDNNFTFVTNETAQQFYPTLEGNYAVIVEASSCVDTSACFSVFPWSINEMASEFQMQLFPNPFLSKLYVSLHNQLENGSLKIMSVPGSKVYEMNNINGKQFELNLDELNEGVYFLYLTDKKTSYRKVIVKPKN